MITQQKVSLDDFIQFVSQPENESRVFELINGEIIEKMPGRASNSTISANLIVGVGAFCKQHSLPRFITGEAGSYRVLGRVVAPDFAYKQTPTSSECPDPVPPLWVAKVISENDTQYAVRAKRQLYLQAGILYWEIYPEDRGIDVYTPSGSNVHSYQENDTLDVGDLIPGFKLIVRELFG